MKTNRRLFYLGSAFVALWNSAHGVDFVRQIQLIEGQTVVYDTPVGNKSGTLWSKPLSGTGAIFQLYAYKDDSLSNLSLVDANVGSNVHANISLQSHLIDINAWGLSIDLFLGAPEESQYLPLLLSEKTVGTYIPEGTISLISKDTHYPPRTRADQPYQAVINVAKLPPASQELPAGAPRVVSVEQSYKLYHPTLFLPAGNGAGEGRYSTGLELSLNGTFSLSSVYQQLPGNLPTQAVGEETFTASVKVGTSQTKATIASATIQVWPVAKVEIQGIPAEGRFINVPDKIQADLTNLYPDSITYARIYKGEARLGANGNTIGSSVISYNTYSPQKAVVPINGLDDYVKEDGTYTIEIVTITPFNNRQPERLAYTTFQIDRTIEINSSTTTVGN